MTRDELENRMVVLLGGRAAEYVLFCYLSTGAADDLVKATDTARSMVRDTEWTKTSVTSLVSGAEGRQAFGSSEPRRLYGASR